MSFFHWLISLYRLSNPTANIPVFSWLNNSWSTHVKPDMCWWNPLAANKKQTHPYSHTVSRFLLLKPETCLSNFHEKSPIPVNSNSKKITTKCMDIVSIVVQNMLRSSFCLENFSCLLQLLPRNKKVTPGSTAPVPRRALEWTHPVRLGQRPEVCGIFVDVSWGIVQIHTGI